MWPKTEQRRKIGQKRKKKTQIRQKWTKETEFTKIG